MQWRWTEYFSVKKGACVFLASGIILMQLASVLTEGQERFFKPDLLAGKILIVDPGHGGIDRGAVGALGEFEKEITLQIGVRIAERLRGAGVNVIMTRDSDIDYYTRGKGGKQNDLKQRITIAQQNQGELFVSIHANAIKGRNWSGAQVFYDNSSEEGKRLADTIQTYLADFPPGNKRKAKTGDYYILRNNAIPAVIVEVGFLSNAEEAARLKDEDYQNRLVEAIFRGIVHYVAEKAELQ